MPRSLRSALDRIKDSSLVPQYALRDMHEPQFWLSHDRRHILVGYLMQDSMCEPPLDSCEGMGTILNSRHNKNFLYHIGMDCEGNRILDEQYVLLARLRGIDVDDLPGTDDVQAAAEDLWDEARARGQIGTPYARALVDDSYGGYREADVSDFSRRRICAVWMPDSALTEHLDTFEAGQRRAAEAEKAFLSALEEHNRWAEGDCWGYVVEHFQKGACGRYHDIEDDLESCWGYIGQEWALEELKSVMKHFRKSLKIKETKRSPKKICSRSVEKPVANHT